MDRAAQRCRDGLELESLAESFFNVTTSRNFTPVKVMESVCGSCI